MPKEKMNYLYKQAKKADIALFRELMSVFAIAFNDIDAYQRVIPTDEYLHVLLEKSNVIVLTAQHGQEVVGGLVAYVLDKFEQDRREIYIYDLAVAEAHRRQGVATELIRQLQTIAIEKDAYIIYVQADHGDEAAIQLYESLGSREEVLHFDIPVRWQG